MTRAHILNMYTILNKNVLFINSLLLFSNCSMHFVRTQILCIQNYYVKIFTRSDRHSRIPLLLSILTYKYHLHFEKKKLQVLTSLLH